MTECPLSRLHWLWLRRQDLLAKEIGRRGPVKTHMSHHFADLKNRPSLPSANGPTIHDEEHAEVLAPPCMQARPVALLTVSQKFHARRPDRCNICGMPIRRQPSTQNVYRAPFKPIQD